MESEKYPEVIEPVLTGFNDVNGVPIKVGDVVRYVEEGHEETYTVTPFDGHFLLVSHEDYEYNAWLGDVEPLEIVNPE